MYHPQRHSMGPLHQKHPYVQSVPPDLCIQYIGCNNNNYATLKLPVSFFKRIRAMEHPFQQEDRFVTLVL